MKKDLNLGYSLALCFGLMFSLLLNACNGGEDEQWDIKDIRIESARVIETPLGEQQEIDLPNCGGTSPLKQTLANFASVQYGTTIGEKAITEAGAEVGIPESIRINLKQEIEAAYQQEYTAQSSILNTYEMETLPQSHVVYVAEWMEHKYDSVVTFVEKGEVHRTSYQYVLLIPRLCDSYQKDCPESAPKKTYTLTMSVIGNGSTNPTEGAQSYNEGEEVHIRANPSQGYSFDHWEGDAHGTNPVTTITMDSNKNVIAYFIPSALTLSIHVIGQGNTNPVRGSHTYDSGQLVTLSANPSQGYSFDHWEGDAHGTNPVTTITMDSDKNVIAYFIPSTLTLSIQVIGQGTTSPSQGSHTYDSGQLVTLSANPSQGYSFDHWEGDAHGTNPVTTITMDSDKSVTACFEVAKFSGEWLNEDPATGGITRVDIRYEANKIIVHMWGKCYPTDCDWGEEMTDISDATDGVLSISWTTSFCIRTQKITMLSDGRLKVDTHTHFTDNSGRPDYDSTNFFLRE